MIVNKYIWTKLFVEHYFTSNQETKKYINSKLTNNTELVYANLLKIIKKSTNNLKHIFSEDHIYNCNNIEKPLPDGFDVEVFTMNSLRLIQKISITSAYKEHVTFGYFIYC